MKIVYSLPYTWNAGGIDRVIVVKANYLAEELGYDVTVVTTEQKGRPAFFGLSSKVQSVDLGINYTDHKGGRFGKTKESFRKGQLHRHRLEQLLMEIHPDIFISAYRRELPFLYKLRDGSVKIYEQHFCRGFRKIDDRLSRLGWIKETLIEAWEESLISKLRYGVLLTQEEREKKWPHLKNAIVMPNPITIKTGKNATLDFKRVIAVGRISYQKGFDRLVKAWSLIEPKFPDWSLSIIGTQDDSYELNKIKDVLEVCQLKHVELLQPTTNIEKQYEKSSILALTSRYEGFGLVLTEAMSYGVPCVAMACQCGPRDVITDGKDGILVPEGDIEAFASALERLMKNDEERKRMGGAALLRSKDFALPQIMSRWDNLFNQILEGR